MVIVKHVTFSAKTQLWCVVVVGILAMVMEVVTLNGPNVCMVKQKYNITKRIKYTAPMSVRTYEWCFSIPPRCSKWTTEMRDLTRLETEERTAEVAVCCPGYKMRDVSCVPICPNGKTGHRCSEDCPQSKWGPNCVNDCPPCSEHGPCSPITGECSCQDGWQGESCESRMSASTTTTTTARVEELLTISQTKPIPPITSTIPSATRKALVETSSNPASSRTTLLEIVPSTSRTTEKYSSPIPDLKSVTPRSSIITSTETSSSPSSTISKESTSNSSSTNIKEVTSTPRMGIKEMISTPNKIPLLEIGLRQTTVLESSTVQTTLFTTPIRSTVATTEILTTNPSVTMPNILTSTSEISTTNKPTTQEAPTTTPVITKSVLVEETTHKKEKVTEKMSDTVTTTTTTEPHMSKTMFSNGTLTTFGLTNVFTPTETTKPFSNSIYNRTEPPIERRKSVNEIHVEIQTTPVKIFKSNDILSSVTPQKTTVASFVTENPVVTSSHATTNIEIITKVETTRRPDATIRYFPTTVKFKPKEIWIRPAQKGESFAEGKKISHESHTRHRATNKEPTPNTTPKTIIVSIIPTSVSYATFKKIALTTSSLQSETTNMTLKSHNNSMEPGFTKPMSVLTTTSPLTSKTNTTQIRIETTTKPSNLNIVNSSKSNSHIHRAAKTLSTLSNTRTTWKNKTLSLNGTNSMKTIDQNINSSNSVTPTVSSTNSLQTTHKPSVTTKTIKYGDDTKHTEKVTKHPFVKIVTVKPRNVTIITVSGKNNDTVKIAKTVVKDLEMTNATKSKDINAITNKITTESPDDEQTFHILTEPEHITAVMEGKGKETTSVDLISVISIAGGIMMAVITVAVIIVMVERCRRPRYEDVRKINDIHMQVMIDNNDVPPPYVRSIFHTPLPDPPTSEKCHYQPISTLDRNLKQFMRPVVVQTISPIMLENFRGILECHYDHLPRRSQDFEVRQKHCSIPPSIEDVDELTHLRPCSIAESTIDALKCEAKLDVLDSSTSEPLYAEIPCWRPPSEHAIEIMNLNGEAVTEL